MPRREKVPIGRVKERMRAFSSGLAAGNALALKCSAALFIIDLDGLGSS